MSEKFFIQAAIAGQDGPHSVETLRQMLDEGRLTAFSQIRREDQKYWRSVASFSVLVRRSAAVAAANAGDGQLGRSELNGQNERDARARGGSDSRPPTSLKKASAQPAAPVLTQTFAPGPPPATAGTEADSSQQQWPPGPPPSNLPKNRAAAIAAAKPQLRGTPPVFPEAKAPPYGTTPPMPRHQNFANPRDRLIPPEGANPEDIADGDGRDAPFRLDVFDFLRDLPRSRRAPLWRAVSSEIHELQRAFRRNRPHRHLRPVQPWVANGAAA